MENTTHFVVFSSYHLLFGVYAGQVEELLDEKDLCVREERERKYTISYRGSDIRLVNFSAWLKSKQNEQKSDIEDQPPSAPAGSRKVLIIHEQQQGYTGVEIDSPGELITLSISQVHQLPVLMQKTGQIKEIWGIALVDERPVILIDLSQIE